VISDMAVDGRAVIDRWILCVLSALCLLLVYESSLFVARPHAWIWCLLAEINALSHPSLPSHSSMVRGWVYVCEGIFSLSLRDH
jgi:hypothetical protein